MFSNNIGRNRLKIAFFVILFLVVNSQAFGAGKISGAFGVKLGQKFTPSSAIAEIIGESKDLRYTFHPKKPFRSFNNYYVSITPKTHLVYAIWGIGPINNGGSCQKEKDLVMSILEEKYGKRVKSLVQDRGAINRGNRIIAILCDKSKSNKSNLILIGYTDVKLGKLAEKERLNLEKSKVDSSGL